MRNLYRIAVSALLLVMLGCAVPPTMKDVEQIATDTRVVFGSVDVYVNDDKEKWGIKFTGSNYFYLTILPPDSNEAITYRLGKEGVFYWTLPPGEYTLLGYFWQNLQTERSGHIGTSFRVPDAGPDVYVGSIEFHGNVALLVPRIEDRFDQIAALYDKKFPGRQGSTVKQLFEPPKALGSFSAYRGNCHDDWNIECDKRFRGVTPVSPEVGQSGFPVSNTLMPEFRWKGCKRGDVSYDLVLYEAAAYAVGGATIPSYMRGRVAAYVEDLKQPRWQPETPLKPDTRYFWSVRLREGDTVSGWSTQSHSTFLLVYMSWGHGQWFQFKTA